MLVQNLRNPGQNILLEKRYRDAFTRWPPCTLAHRRAGRKRGEGPGQQMTLRNIRVSSASINEVALPLGERQCAELTDEIVPGHDWGPVDSAPLGAFLDCRGGWLCRLTRTPLFFDVGEQLGKGPPRLDGVGGAAGTVNKSRIAQHSKVG